MNKDQIALFECDDSSHIHRLHAEAIIDKASLLFNELASLDSDERRIDVINALKRMLHLYSPMKNEPVDCVIWERIENVTANDYNPNTVAPPEMKLLEHSIAEDGYTQPIVTWKIERGYEVVDGFHRNRVGRESKAVRKRTNGYLPLTIINTEREDRNDRIAATIRHNRARGKHRVEAMSDIVIELKRRNWTNERISRELGMDEDEILRLCQITGLADLFSDQQFSKSWDVEGQVTEEDFQELTDDITTYGKEAEDFRTVNTSDESRIFHTYEKWECYKAGLYATSAPEGMTKADCEERYRTMLSNIPEFSTALERVIVEWPHSCEHYLTNGAMNRVAWMGQAALCWLHGIPSIFRSGFYLLTGEQQTRANEVALYYLNKWLAANGRKTATLEEAYSGDRQSDIY